MPPHSESRPFDRLRALVFTRDFKQGRRLVVVLMTAVVYAICASLLLVGAERGLFDPAARTVAGLCLATVLVYAVVIRSGLNMRFRQPSLALPQALCAQTLITLAYAVTGAAHGVSLALLATVMVFGMFEMKARHVGVLLCYTLVAMGGTMMYCVQTRPAIYQADIQAMFFAVLATILPAISSLSMQLMKMRERLHRQKIELGAALEQIRTIATHDELTGLPNRRHMMTLLAEHAARHARGGPPFAVALADLDHFKSVNDRFGHRIGDEALICFAKQSRLHLRNTDIAARWGGEEFLLLLPASPPGDPNIGIERLRGALSVAQTSAHAPNLRIAFSTGLTYYIPGEAIDELVDRADKALYLAKSAGRNQTQIVLH